MDFNVLKHGRWTDHDEIVLLLVANCPGSSIIENHIGAGPSSMIQATSEVLVQRIHELGFRRLDIVEDLPKPPLKEMAKLIVADIAFDIFPDHFEVAC